MASASITTKTTRAGERRYLVRYRCGGRMFPIQNAGTFGSLRDAKTRRDLVAGELAAGRNPAILLGTLTTPLVVESFSVWADRYRASRVDWSEASKRNSASHVKAMQCFDSKAPEAITPADVQDWIAGLGSKPSTARVYMATLRGILDYAGVDPNPARDQRVRLPRAEHVEVDPPSSADVEQIILHTPARWRLALTFLAETGMRVGELCGLVWGDVDQVKGRVRVKHGKTAAARRWVMVPSELVDEVMRSAAADDQAPDARIFPGASQDRLRSVMARACQSAKIAHYHPHDLRHRYASVQIARGVPVTTLAAQLGHSKKSLTLDTYSHVLLDDDEA